MRRPWVWISILVLAVAAVWFLSARPRILAPSATEANAKAKAPPSPESARESESHSTLAAELNTPDGTIERDLVIVDSVFEAFRTNIPGGGNPVGENNEITAALTGRNRLGLQLIPRRHPAINHRGELVDRWGTPFFFHQLSGDVMEIRSAGPDRVMHTEDDTVLAP